MAPIWGSHYRVDSTALQTQERLSWGSNIGDGKEVAKWKGLVESPGGGGGGGCGRTWQAEEGVHAGVL